MCSPSRSLHFSAASPQTETFSILERSGFKISLLTACHTVDLAWPHFIVEFVHHRNLGERAVAHVSVPCGSLSCRGRRGLRVRMRSCESPRKRKDLRSQLTMALVWYASFPDDGPRPGSVRWSSTVYCTGNCVQYYI